MKIVFHRYNSICEPDYIEAFKALGLEVVEEDREIYEKNIPGDERVRILAETILENSPAFVFSINFFPYIAAVCEKLKVLYVCLSVDCPVLELYANEIKSQYNRVFLFDYHQYEDVSRLNPDCVFYLPLGTNVASWDAVIMAGTENRWEATESETAGTENRREATESETAGTENRREATESEAASDSNHGFKYDISFVGSLYSEKSPLNRLSLSDYDRGYIEAVINSQRQFPGQELFEKESDIVNRIKKIEQENFPHIENAAVELDAYTFANYYLSPKLSSIERIDNLNMLAEYFKQTDLKVHLFTRSDTSPLKNVVCHDGVSTATQMPLVFNQSKINLNMTIRSIQTGLSQRIWDVLGCGGFLLTNYQMELPEYFELGKHLDAYESTNELIEKCAYYLEHEDVRMEIANQGHLLVKEKHTVINRVVEMLKHIV